MTTFPFRISQEQLSVLSTILVENIEDILADFDVDAKRRGNKMVGRCPVHDGDNKAAWNLYLNDVGGTWVCRTHGCEKIFQKSIIGLIRGLLSRKKYNWSGSGDKFAGFEETINWIQARTKTKLSDIKINEMDIIKSRLVRQTPTSIALLDGAVITRDMVRQHLYIPSKTFIDRGFNPPLLDSYDIGDCLSSDTNKEMYGRAVVPIYDVNYTKLVGCTGRAIHPQCKKCLSYHKEGTCVDANYAWGYTKWRHSKSLKAEQNLFNLWFAKKHIQSRGTAILVESPGNVLRLEQAGIHNSICSFGAHLTDSQQMLLTICGTMNLIVISDRDEAGNKCFDQIKQDYSRLYNIRRIIPSTNDVADMTDEQVKDEIQSKL